MNEYPFTSIFYNSKYCPKCETLVYPYENTGDVCNCKDPWTFSSDDRADFVRLQWVEVQVCIHHKKFLDELVQQAEALRVKNRE